MSGWAALAQAGMEIGGQLLQAHGQHQANRTNIRIAREQMAFQERMSNTEYQRSVADLKAAGLNPMLSVMKGGGASTPPGASTRVENEYSGASNSAGAIARVLTNALMKAQVDKTTAEADKARSEAEMTRAQVPYSADSARLSLEKLEYETERTANEVLKIVGDLEIQKLTTAQLEQLQPLVVKAQELSNAAAKYGLSEAKALSEFYDSVGGASKWAELLKMVMALRRN